MKPKKQVNRNFGLDHAVGKGDKSRVDDLHRYTKNYDEIDWRHAVRTKPNPAWKPAHEIFHAHKFGPAKFSFQVVLDTK